MQARTSNGRILTEVICLRCKGQKAFEPAEKDKNRTVRVCGQCVGNGTVWVIAREEDLHG